jgi:hypothetical protein
VKSWAKLLVKTGLLSEPLARTAEQEGAPLDFVVRRGHERGKVLKVVSAELGIDWTAFERDRVDITLVGAIGGWDWWHMAPALPLETDSGPVPIAMSDPLDMAAVDNVSLVINGPMRLVLALSGDLERQFRLRGTGEIPSNTKACPSCGGRLIPFLYGEATDEALGAARRGELILGTCCRTGEDPSHQCKGCGRRYVTR